MRISADVIEIDEEITSECSASNQVQAQASSGAIPKQFGKVKINENVFGIKHIDYWMGYGESFKKLTESVEEFQKHYFKLPKESRDKNQLPVVEDICSCSRSGGNFRKMIESGAVSYVELPKESKDKKTVNVIETIPFPRESKNKDEAEMHGENLWSPFPLEKEAEMGIAKLEKMRFKHMEMLDRIQKRIKTYNTEAVLKCKGLQKKIKEETPKNDPLQNEEDSEHEKLEDLFYCNWEKLLKLNIIIKETEFRDSKRIEYSKRKLQNILNKHRQTMNENRNLPHNVDFLVDVLKEIQRIQTSDMLAKARIASLSKLRLDLKHRANRLHLQMRQIKGRSAENCGDSRKNQGKSFLDFEKVMLNADFSENHAGSKKKQWNSLLDDKEVKQTEVESVKIPDTSQKNQWKSSLDAKADKDGTNTGLTKFHKVCEGSNWEIKNFCVEQNQSTAPCSNNKLLTDSTDTSDSGTDEETWTPPLWAFPPLWTRSSALLIEGLQSESEEKNESTEQKNEKAEEPQLVCNKAKHAETGHADSIEFMKCRKENSQDTLSFSVPKEHVCRAFKRSESVNEKKEKTDERYMASPMKRRKAGGLLKHAMKRRFERHRNHDLCIHRHFGPRSYESLFHSRQAMKMREMCKKFSDLKLTENDFKENIKNFDHMYMHYMAKSKMDEVKVKNPKAKINEETPPQWMVEFLLKMKQEIKEEIVEELSNLPRIEMQGHSSSGGKGDENQYQGDVIHPGIFCDNCDQLIHGIRYKCGNCTDFDLCQECESLPNIHNKNHIFLKIRYPVALKLYQKQKWQPFVLPNPGELFPSSTKSHQPKKLYEAKFVRDETVPDGTVLSPSTRFVKSWRVLNSGKRVWTHSTKLQHIQGSAGLTPASEQVDVPHLRPGEEGIVSVLFTTPSVPGVYRSHWNFCHKSRPFGHIVWCHIVVKDLEQEEKQVENANEKLQLPDEKGQEVASIAEVLTAVKEEHERGNIIPRKLAVKSHTATPNNTPFDLTPPKSPDHQAVSELKEIAEDKESVNSKQNIDFDPEDEVSVVSLSSSESDTEFVVIPMPKCFNLSESFSSQNIPPLSQYLQSDVAGDQTDLKSEHKLVKPRRIFTKRAANTETVSQETGVPELSAHSEAKKEMKEKESEEKILISHNVSADGSSSEISIIESGESSPMEENVTPKISSIHIAVTSDMNLNTDVNCTVTDDKGNVQQVEETEKEEPVTDIPASATFPKFPVEGITSIYEPASSNTEERTVQVLPERLVTAPLNAAATLYKTARDVISSFQHQGNAHARNNRDVGTSGTVSSAQLNPMEQLIEMGFCNRQKNEELLKKHKNDVALVVAELVSLNDNDWYAYRHVPATTPTYFD